MKRNRQEKGITLIALVVTIIILLILAGVTLNIALGENGLFKMASQSGEVAKDVSEEEKVKLAVSGAFLDGTGTLSKDNLEKALKSEFGEDATLTGDGPWTFKGERKTYTIETNGKITAGSSSGGNDKNAITGDTVSVANYGDRVDYVAAGKPDLIWRIFHKDENNVYLISSKMTDGVEKCVETSHSLDYSNSKYNDGSDAIISDLRYLNQEWFDKLAGTPSTDDNAKAVAYLMDQEVWGDYKDANKKATYAIGGPTIELFRASFNATKEKRRNPSTEISFTEVNGVGYLAGTSGAYLIPGDIKGIYNIDSKSSCLLASPVGTYNSNVYNVDGSMGRLMGSVVYLDVVLRPIVIIPKSNFQYKILPESDEE